MGTHILDETRFPQSIGDHRADSEVVVPASLGQFSSLHLPVLGRQEGVHEVVDGESGFRFYLLRFRSITVLDVVLERIMGASPAFSEVVDFAVYSLVPVSSFVPVERELWIRFFSVFLIHQHPPIWMPCA